MPPKTANSTAAAKPNGKKSQKADEEFDQLLKELAKSTKAKGKMEAAANKDGNHTSQADRKAAHKKKAEDQAKAREAQIAKSIEERAQQKRLQDMIREMMARSGQGAFGSPFLENPVTDIETHEAQAKAPSKLVAGCAAMQGWRKNMEDAHILFPNFRKGGDGDVHLFAVMDGHGGDQVAKTTKVILPAVLHTELEASKGQLTDAAITKAFLETDNKLKMKHGEDGTCGCTCVSVLITDKEVICASVGDSRAVLARQRTNVASVVAMAQDHKPENEAEAKRIKAASGTVENNRVNGNLAMSRALGDFTYKQSSDKPFDEQQVIAVPDIVRATRMPDDEFVVIACDGIFDVLSNTELVDVVRSEMTKINPDPNARFSPAQLSFMAANVTKICLAPQTESGNPSRGEGTDNMSIIIVQL